MFFFFPLMPAVTHAWEAVYNVMKALQWKRRDVDKNREMMGKEKRGIRCIKALQFKGLVPGGVEAALDGLGLLFTLTAWVWDQFELHVGVWQTVGVHRNQIFALFDCKRREQEKVKSDVRIKETKSVFVPGSFVCCWTIIALKIPRLCVCVNCCLCFVCVSSCEAADAKSPSLV